MLFSCDTDISIEYLPEIIIQEINYLTDSTSLVTIEKVDINEVIESKTDLSIDILSDDDNVIESVGIKWIKNERNNIIGELNQEINIDSLSKRHNIVVEITSKKVVFKKNESYQFSIEFEGHKSTNNHILK